MDIWWMRRQGIGKAARSAHAFARIDVTAGFEMIEPLGACATFTVVGLVEVTSDYPYQCEACSSAVAHAVERVQ